MLHIGRCTLAVTMDLTERKITKIAREASKLAVRTLKEDGIGTAEYDFIHLVRHHPGITQAEVREQLRVDKGAAARRAASLEAKGYLIRQANPKDGRSQLLFATEKGETVRESMDKSIAPRLDTTSKITAARSTRPLTTFCIF